MTHYHVTKWVDHFPLYSEEDNKDLDNLIRELFEDRRKQKKTPIAIHCKGGIGRTCTFICLFYIYKKLKSKFIFRGMFAKKGIQSSLLAMTNNN